MSELMGIHWAGADRVIFVPIFLVLIFLIFRNYNRLRGAATQLANAVHQKTIFKNFSPRRLLLKSLCLATGLVCIFIALLQPQWGKKEQTIIQEGRDVLIVLDISRSMLAKDMTPTRLDFAKLKIRNLLARLNSERVGLIVFSGSAFVQCPLTSDTAAFLMFLEHVDTETMSSGTTSLDAALTKTLEVFGTAAGRKNKLVVLLTDGEDFSLNMNAVQQKAIQEQLNLFALGVGTSEGAPIPKLNLDGTPSGHEVDESGNIVLSILNEKMLQQLCSSLHGHYIKATYDDGDINQLVGRIARYEKETFEDKKMSLFHDQYPWLLGMAWILLALEWIL